MEILLQQNPNRPHPTDKKEPKTHSNVEKGDIRRPVKQELDALMVFARHGCDNCNWKIDRLPVCTNKCVPEKGQKL